MNPFLYGRAHEAWERIHTVRARPASITDAELEELIVTTLEAREPDYGHPVYTNRNRSYTLEDMIHEAEERIHRRYQPLITAVMESPVTMTRPRLDKLKRLAEWIDKGVKS